MEQEKSSLPTVLITGGSSGIGYETARLFYNFGYRVFLLGRTKNKINQAVLSLQNQKNESNRLRGYAVDVSDEKNVSKLFQGWDKENTTVEILINNAGIITPIAQIDESIPSEWMNTIKTNLYGAYVCTQQAILRMVKKRKGVIINISSGAAHTPLEGWSAYCASKAALYMFTACLHEEYKDIGIRVFGYRPGMVDTPMQETVRRSGINRVSQVKRSELLSPTVSVQGIFYLARSSENDYLGKEVDIRDLEFQKKASL